jgi:hypothetical protein
VKPWAGCFVVDSRAQRPAATNGRHPSWKWKLSRESTTSTQGTRARACLGRDQARVQVQTEHTVD